MAHSHTNYPVVSAGPWLSPGGQGAGWEESHVGEGKERALPLKQMHTAQSNREGQGEGVDFGDVHLSLS